MMTANATDPRQPTNVHRLLLLLVLAISAFIQFTVVSRTVVENPLRADAGEYFAYAFNLHEYGTYTLERTWDTIPPHSLVPDKMRSPGYPLFLAALGKPEPIEAYGLRVTYVQAGLGVLSVWLVYLIAVTFAGPAAALSVAFLTAINPQLATISTYLLTESLFTFLLLASVLMLARAVHGGRLWMWAGAGLLWGLCSLVRPTAQYFLPLLLVAVFLLPRLRAFRKPALVAFSAFLLTLSPWLLRNLSDSVSNPGTSMAVNTLAHGSYPGFMYDGRPGTFAYPYRADPRIKEITKDMPSILSHIASKFREQPRTYATWYLLGKPYFFLSMEDVQSFDVMIYPTSRTPYYEDLKFAILRTVSLALHWPLTILGLAGAALLAIRPEWLQLDDRGRSTALMVALVVAYGIALHMVVAPFPRYSIPFRPLLFALALLPFTAIYLALPATIARGRRAQVVG